MLCLGLSCLLLHVFVVFAGELTFELPDNDKQCFYQELEKDVKFEIDFQVSWLHPLPSHTHLHSVFSRCCQVMVQVAVCYLSCVFLSLVI